MLDKFQQKVNYLLKNSPKLVIPEDNSAGAGGAFGSNVSDSTFQNTPIKVDMCVAGGTAPPKKKYKKSKKNVRKNSKFPVIKRPLSNMANQF
jgi:hypothetical protein